MSIYGKLLQETSQCKRHTISTNDHKIIEIFGYTSEDNMFNALVKVENFDGYLRGRSEMILLSQDRKSVFLQLNKDGTYKVPGGGWNENEDHMLSAIRETQEEIHHKSRNVKYIGNYIEKYNNKKDYQKKIPMQYKWVGVFSEVYSGIDDGMYTKLVNKEDQDDMYWKGDFYDISEVESILLPIHKLAIKSQLEVN